MSKVTNITLQPIMPVQTEVATSQESSAMSSKEHVSTAAQRVLLDEGLDHTIDMSQHTETETDTEHEIDSIFLASTEQTIYESSMADIDGGHTASSDEGASPDDEEGHKHILERELTRYEWSSKSLEEAISEQEVGDILELLSEGDDLENTLYGKRMRRQERKNPRFKRGFFERSSHDNTASNEDKISTLARKSKSLLDENRSFFDQIIYKTITDITR